MTEDGAMLQSLQTAYHYDRSAFKQSTQLDNGVRYHIGAARPALNLKADLSC